MCYKYIVKKLNFIKSYKNTKKKTKSGGESVLVHNDPQHIQVCFCWTKDIQVSGNVQQWCLEPVQKTLCALEHPRIPAGLSEGRGVGGRTTHTALTLNEAFKTCLKITESETEGK